MSNFDEEKENNDSPGVDLTRQVSFNSASVSDSNKPPVWAWFGLATLILIALLVIFVLPTVVSEYQLPFEPRVDTLQIQPAIPIDSNPEISPFEQAQQARQRKEAQDVLAELLEFQSQLEQLNVQSWAMSEFEAALETASLGDNFYREQNFLEARETYFEGSRKLSAILDSVGDVFKESLRQAQDAFDYKNAESAIEQFTLAKLLDPDSEEAKIGLERALVLDQVLSLATKGQQLLEDNALEESRRIFEEILSIDSRNESAKITIEEISQLIVNADFAQVMSRGYSLLQAEEAEEAILQFQAALNFGVREEEALAAINQAENDIANKKISAIQKLIDSAEDQEDWDEAVVQYDGVLEIDPNIVFAIEGRDYASKRAQLNDLLVSSINGPDRFYEQDVFQQTLDIYYTGREVEKERGGPLLSGQLDKLEQLLETSQIPVEIQFASDNLTDVSILRVTNLGLFEETSVSLKPGRYVAQGKRIGYREIRTEFVVGFGQTPDVVNVLCTERIVPTNR